AGSAWVDGVGPPRLQHRRRLRPRDEPAPARPCAAAQRRRGALDRQQGDAVRGRPGGRRRRDRGDGEARPCAERVRRPLPLHAFVDGQEGDRDRAATRRGHPSAPAGAGVDRRRQRLPAAAQTQLEAKHLRYRVVYRLAQNAPANQVLGQIPAAGATVYTGTRVRLTVSRTLRWVKVLSQSGTDGYVSDPFTVPDRWRIR